MVAVAGFAVRGRRRQAGDGSPIQGPTPFSLFFLLRASRLQDCRCGCGFEREVTTGRRCGHVWYGGFKLEEVWF